MLVFLLFCRSDLAKKADYGVKRLKKVINLNISEILKQNRANCVNRNHFILTPLDIPNDA